MLDILEDFSLSQTQVVAATTDNGKNYCAAFKHYGIVPEDPEDEARLAPPPEDPEQEEPQMQDVEEALKASDPSELERLPPHYKCAAHTLNLLATTDISDVPGWNQGLRSAWKKTAAKSQALWNFQNTSTVAAASIKAALGRKLITPCQTRWNSFYDSVKCLLEHVFDTEEHLQAINSILSSQKKPYRFDAVNKEVLQEYVKVLSPVAEALDMLQGEEHAFMGNLLPFLSLMRQELLDLEHEDLRHAKPLVKALLDGVEGSSHKGFEARFGSLFRNRELLMATATHPCFALAFIRRMPLSEDLHQEVKARLVKELSDLVKNGDQAVEVQVPKEEPQSKYSKFMAKAWSLGSEHERQRKSVTENVEDEVNNFKGIKTGDPVTRELFPFLHRDEWVEVFIRYNTPLPSSAAVERLFSSGGDILRSKRASLTSANFESLVFLKGNLALLSLRQGPAGVPDDD